LRVGAVPLAVALATALSLEVFPRAAAASFCISSFKPFFLSVRRGCAASAVAQPVALAAPSRRLGRRR